MHENQNLELLNKIQELEKQNEDLLNLNAVLTENNEQLLANEEEMKQLSEIIYGQRQLLEKKSDELEEKNSKILESFRILKEKEEELIFKNNALLGSEEELKLQNEEILSQKEILDVRTTELESLTDRLKANEKILQKAYDKLKIKEQELLDLNAELEKLSIVARETDNAVSIFDSDYNLIWINEGFTRLYGYSFNGFIENIGRNIFEISSNPKIRKIVTECIETKKSVSFQSQTVSSKSNLIWTQTTLTPLTDNQNNVTKLIGIESDICKLKEAEFEIENKKNELEVKNFQLNIYNENIKASIRYAQTIQQAILPRLENIKLFETFVFFKPRDIVSGDFYWHTQIVEDNNVCDFFATVDCTGHGVPGAFMSMIGNSLLNEIINEKKILQTDDILTTLNYRIVQALNQEFSSNTDGMDICLVKIVKNGNGSVINYSGAKRPLFYFDNKLNIIESIKGSRRSIGGNVYRSEEKFNLHEIELVENSILYLTSDGYIDQNSPDRKRFGTQKFHDFLNEICRNPFTIQLEKLNEKIIDYMQYVDQRDDILIWGIKV
jgi:PAS domain S-box-containing protein